jgi:3-hydroxypropanoate dehydrogenase
MTDTLSDPTLDQLFREARTHNGWLERQVEDDTLRALFDLTKMAPTSANSSPARFVFIKSREAKERLRPTLSPGNVDKTMSAPVVIIVAQDTRFYDELPKVFPHADARSWFLGKPELIEATAFRNSSMQAGYLILAARSLGLDVGPLSGFDNAALDRVFFPDGRYRSNLLVNLGYGDPQHLKPRLPRFDFDDACKIV